MTYREATVEHLTPRSEGGTNVLSNLDIACLECNNQRSWQNSKGEEVNTDKPRLIQFPNGTWMDPSQVSAILIFDRVRVNIQYGRRETMFGELPSFNDPYGPHSTYTHEVKFASAEEAEAFRDQLAKEVNDRCGRKVGNQ